MDVVYIVILIYYYLLFNRTNYGNICGAYTTIGVDKEGTREKYEEEDGRGKT